jgi:hypothetical protein
VRGRLAHVPQYCRCRVNTEGALVDASVTLCLERHTPTRYTGVAWCMQQERCVRSLLGGRDTGDVCSVRCELIMMFVCMYVSHKEKTIAAAHHVTDGHTRHRCKQAVPSTLHNCTETTADHLYPPPPPTCQPAITWLEKARTSKALLRPNMSLTHTTHVWDSAGEQAWRQKRVR